MIIKNKSPIIGNLWHNETFFGDILRGENRMIESVDDLNDIDLLVFWGGEDISATLYGEKSVYSYGNAIGRDKFETLIYQAALGAVPMLGICRGAQMLCAQTGGKLWQHVDNHGRDHGVTMKDGSTFMVTSTHHQMMRPGEGTEILGWSEKPLSPLKKNGYGAFNDDSPEPEFCFNADAQALMVQGHPEYAGAHLPFVREVRDSINKYLGVK